MNEDIAAADFLQEDAFGGVVEKVCVVPGCTTLAKEYEAENAVFNNGFATAHDEAKGETGCAPEVG